MVVAHREPPRDALGDAAEVAPHTLTDRLQGLKARSAGGSVDADTFGRAVIHGDEHGGGALVGPGGGQIGAPQRIHRSGDDAAVMRLWAAWRAGAAGGQQPMLAHQPEYPSTGGANALVAQPGPDLAMTFAMEPAGGQHHADFLHQNCIWHRAGRSRTSGRRRGYWQLMAINAGAGDSPDPADRGQTVWPAADRRNGPAHRLGLRRPKGRLASSIAIFSCNRSRSISAAPSFAFSRSLSSSSPLAGFVASAASPAARKASRPPLSVAAVTPRPRDTVSRSSPRNNRTTVAVFRCRDILPPRPSAAAPDSCGRSAPPGRD